MLAETVGHLRERVGRRMRSRRAGCRRRNRRSRADARQCGTAPGTPRGRCARSVDRTGGRSPRRRSAFADTPGRAAAPTRASRMILGAPRPSGTPIPVLHSTIPATRSVCWTAQPIAIAPPQSWAASTSGESGVDVECDDHVVEVGAPGRGSGAGAATVEPLAVPHPELVDGDDPVGGRRTGRRNDFQAYAQVGLPWTHTIVAEPGTPGPVSSTCQRCVSPSWLATSSSARPRRVDPPCSPRRPVRLVGRRRSPDDFGEARVEARTDAHAEHPLARR